MPAYAAFTYGLHAHNGKGAEKALFGGKGAGLLQMSASGLPVPEAAVFTTVAWKHYRDTGELPDTVTAAIHRVLSDFPDALFSVRSGAPISMPGMMDTVLNVGATPELEAALYPGAYRRFVAGWLSIVKDTPKAHVEKLVHMVDQRVTGGNPDVVPHIRRRAELLRRVVQSASGVAVPETPFDQIASCVKAVFDSWDTPRAKAYRAMHGIPENMGTGCVVQRMVMGTAKGLSGSGVMFSRDPATGDQVIRGEIAFDAQGEEVVSGEITPLNLSNLENGPPDHQHLSGQLAALAFKLEATYGDVQDIEFTVENGKLYVLQTRTAKMSAKARIRTALEMADASPDPFEFVRARVSPALASAASVPEINAPGVAPLATGLAASPGVMSGTIAFRSTPLSQLSKGSILVAADTAPEDFPAMAASGAILTACGGFTCHSAVVARGIGVPAVVGCDAVVLDSGKQTVAIGGKVFKAGDPITIDGVTGKVYSGALPVSPGKAPVDLYRFLSKQVAATMPDAYQRDWGFHTNVALPLSLSDTSKWATQIQRYDTLVERGKKVVFLLEGVALDEDVLPLSVETLLPVNAATNFKADLEGKKYTLVGIDTAYIDMIHSALGVGYVGVQVVDLLSVLGG